MRFIKWLARCVRRISDALTARRRQLQQIEASLRELEAKAAARERLVNELNELTAQLRSMSLPQPIPLRRPVVDALDHLSEQASRVVSGELPDRRIGPGRRATDR